MQLLNDLVELARKSTALNLESAQVVRGEDGYIECPCCGGEGSVEAGKDYCNIDDAPLGVQFYGIGNDHVLAEQYFRAASPAAILAIAEYVNGLEASLKKANEQTEKFEREMYLMMGKAEDAETKLSNHIPDAGKMIFPDNVPCAGSPDFIWLQVWCDSGEPNVWPEQAWNNVTWNDERIHNDDVLYVNASLIGKPS